MKVIGLIRSLVVTGIAAFAIKAQAQHYPTGAEGIKGGALPPPGVYLRDYNFIYVADRYPGSGLKNFDLFGYVQAPRLIWITDWKILGADYGMDIIVPFGYTQIKIKPAPGYSLKDDAFGLHDIQIEPLLLSWHKEKFDIAAGYAVWAPTGNFDKDDLVNLGSGFWTHMLTLGGVWYPDVEKTWAISLLNRYEIDHEQDQTHLTPGDTYTLEWGLSKSVTKTMDLGLIGYYQQAVTKDHGPSASSELSHVVGFGPEISVAWPKITTFTSLRYIYEADAENRPQGHTITLTVTKRF